MASRYGAQWLLNTWSDDPTYSAFDFYRSIGYHAAKHIAMKGFKRRVREGIFTDEEGDLFVEWVL